MTIQELIQQGGDKHAKVRYRDVKPDGHPEAGDYEDGQIDFEAGASFMLEHIVGFADFISKRGYVLENGWWVNHNLKMAHPNESLFNLYLESLNK